MKKLLYIIPIFGILFISSCSKESSTSSTTPNGRDRDPKLIGTWKYEESTGISNNTIFLLNLNSDGSGSEIVKDKTLSTGVETIITNAPFTWNTASVNHELYFTLSGNEQKTSYSFFIANTNLIISSYLTQKPHFIKQ